MIYASYMGVGCPCDINAPAGIKRGVEKKIDPPFEDLFDQVEQYALTILVRPWLNLILKEKQQFTVVI